MAERTTGHSIPVYELSPGSMVFRQSVGDGEVGGMNFDISLGIGSGALIVEITGTDGQRRMFFVRPQDLAGAAHGVITTGGRS